MLRSSASAPAELLRTTTHVRLPAPVPGAGEDEKEQLACIMEVLGKPPKHILDRSSRASVFFDLCALNWLGG